MSTTKKHRVIVHKLDANGSHVWGHDNRAVVENILEFEDITQAERVMRDLCIARHSLSAASLAPAVELFAPTDITGYLKALNAGARLAEEMAQDGIIDPGLTEDLDHWTSMGVRTPADLADHLDAEFERSMQKEMMCG